MKGVPIAVAIFITGFIYAMFICWAGGLDITTRHDNLAFALCMATLIGGVGAFLHLATKNDWLP